MSTNPTPLSAVDAEIAAVQAAEAAQGTAINNLITDLTGKLDAQAAQIVTLQAALAAANVPSPVTTPINYATELAELAALQAAIAGQTATITTADPGATAAPPAPPATPPGLPPTSTAPTAGPVALPLTTNATAPTEWLTMPLGINTNLAPFKPLYGPNDPFSQDISGFPTHALSAAFIARVATQTLSIDQAHNIYVMDSTLTPYVTMQFDDTVNSDNVQFQMPNPVQTEGASAPGDYTQAIAPPDGPGGDAHVEVVDRATRCIYETISQRSATAANSGRVHDLTKPRQRQYEQPMSVAADGLSILDRVLSYDDALAGPLKTALRVTLPASLLIGHSFWTPACHAGAGADPGTAAAAGCLPMGSMLVLEESWQPPTGITLNALDLNIIAGLKTVGMEICDGGSAGIISSTRDGRWGADYATPADTGTPVDYNGTLIFGIFGKNQTIGLTMGNFRVVDTGRPLVIYAFQAKSGVPAGFSTAPTGAAPALSFTVAKDVTGKYDVLTFTASGQDDILVDGYTIVDASNTLTLPHAGAQTYTARARNQFGVTTALAGVAA